MRWIQQPAWALLSLASFCACAATPTPPPPWEEPTPAAWLDQPLKSTAASILKGFDGAGPVAGWEPGTKVLYAVRTQRDDRATTRFFLVSLAEAAMSGVSTVRVNPKDPPPADRQVLDVADESQGHYELEVRPWRGTIDVSFGEDHQRTSQVYGVRSESILARIVMYDENGREQTARYVVLPEAYLQKGLAAFCEWSARAAASQPQARVPTAEELGLIVEAHCALLSFGRVIGSSSILRPIVSVVIPKLPLLLALFSRPRFDLRIGTCSMDTSSLPETRRYGPACAVNLDILLNDRPTVTGRLVVTRAVGPLRLCGGVLAFEGYRTDRPTRRFSMYLLAARRADAVSSARSKSNPPTTGAAR